MPNRRTEQTALAGLAVLAASVAPNLLPAAQSGYARMSSLATTLLLPSIGLLAFALLGSIARGHARLTRRLLAGAGAGMAATLGLEAVRITSFRLGGMPGDLPRLMGVLLLDRFMLGPSPLSDTLGYLYHFWNGAAFGILFTVISGRRPLWWSVAFGQMIGVGFLLSPVVKGMGIGFMGSEMPTMPLTVMLAHLAFGLILGLLSRRWLGSDGGILDDGLGAHGG